jgi:hypothetical protein
MRLTPVVLLLSSTLAALFAPSAAIGQARIYCCDDAQGRKHCGDFLPAQCTKLGYEVRDEKGFVVERKDPPMTAEQIARREAETARKAEEEKRKVEERRRNLALLSTYSAEKDIDAARDRAVTEVQKLVKQAEDLVGEAQKAKAKVEREKEFYKNKTLPAPVKKQIQDVEADLKAKLDTLAARKADIEKTKAKFEDEKKKFRELKGIVNPGPATSQPLTPTAPATPGVPNAPAAASPSAPAGVPTAPGVPAAPAAPVASGTVAGQVPPPPSPPAR